MQCSSPKPSPSPSRRRSPNRRASPPRLNLPSHPLVIGVLALQGAFREHITLLHKAARVLDLPSSPSASTASSPSNAFSFSAILVRNAQDLAACHALIIPGGESTAIALGVQRAGMLRELRTWVADDRPTWGTCAGMIMLAREASGGKRGGQELIGGMDCRVGRNGFGSQVDSFETQLNIPALGPEPFPAVFIRAPVVDCLLDPVSEAEAAANDHASAGQSSSTMTTTKATETTGALPLIIAPSLLPYRSCRPKSQEAPSISNHGSSWRPPMEILAALAAPVVSSAHSPVADASSHGASPRAEKLVLTASVPRPPVDTQIVALRQGNLVATSFHPELTNDVRLHAFFIRDVVLPSLVRP
ncbi:SNO-domain-containing protein [Tilletiaria anomala UBC 951]|uniref:glutaminase n=1 Tax=Tilletiaria anomala (strain ATCC 24038 / CBS 436.72 / UBC 951) TaxID=1037660 RepID=A0A066VHJ4_TILAU|nr:SNO-domain-containing protein [Tilletiaria anomala UBC 951]KDN39763.1 SNO-domain-containing protein [Tilletiaria anomala UBC 951]